MGRTAKQSRAGAFIWRPVDSLAWKNASARLVRA
jgi:hypothetical protein